MGTLLKDKAVGDIVKLKEDGVLQEYIIVNKGLPSSMYDSSCNGTWLLRKDLITETPFSLSNSSVYETSDVHKWLNGKMLLKYDTNIQSKIKQAKIPYIKNTGTLGNGSNGLSCRIFLLSASEVGLSDSINPNVYYTNEGLRLTYFESGTGTSAKTKRIAKYNDIVRSWWLRSPYKGDGSMVFRVDYEGGISAIDADFSVSYTMIRPALILPSTAELTVNDSGEITLNVAPTVPANITVPSTVYTNEKTSITWGTSTDSDSYLSGYIVEREYDGNGSWAQIYKGSSTTLETVVGSFSTVRFRVKAYDSYGLESDYKTSSSCTIIENTYPSLPASITPPSKIRGGETCEISWGASTDAESNLAGYILERQWDGTGSWSQIYKGPNLTYTDNIPKGTYTKVAYRVKAYDARNLNSGYKTSSVVNIINNDPPTISYSGGHNLGIFALEPPAPWTYTINDSNTSDDLLAAEDIDGVPFRKYKPVRGEENTFAISADEWMKITNGSHTATMIVTDGHEDTKFEVDFEKKVHTAIITMKQPIESETQITLCALSVSGEIPDDATYTVEVTNNCKDEEPTWEDMTADIKVGRNHVFTNQTQTNGWFFNFRIIAERGQEGESEADGYIISVQGGFQ